MISRVNVGPPPSAVRPPRAAALQALCLLFAVNLFAESSATPPKLPGEVKIVQNLDAQIPMNLMLRDEHGRVVRLNQLFHGKPVLMNFVYYRCPMLCSMGLETLVNALTELKFEMGRDYDVITVSIDPRDMPKDALAKKEKYLKRYGRFDAANGWHFLTGPESAVKSLANTVGFYYAYDIEQDQFAHPAMLAVLTPEGKISRYLYGFDYKGHDLRLSLVDASSSKIATPTDKLLLLCYHYDPVSGKYTASTMNAIRAGGAATVMALAGFIVISLKREKKEGKC